jgi:LytS/YehU family sensor histidine kinase
MVPLATEIDRLRSHLQGRGLRVRSARTVACDFDAASLDVPIPNSLLLSLVDRALCRTDGWRRCTGSLTVLTRVIARSLQIAVWDNDARVVTEAQVRRTDSGLRGVREHLRALYGRHASLVVGVAVGGGTIVSLALPIDSWHTPEEAM